MSDRLGFTWTATTGRDKGKKYFSAPCPLCNGDGMVGDAEHRVECPRCGMNGFVTMEVADGE